MSMAHVAWSSWRVYTSWKLAKSSRTKPRKFHWKFPKARLLDQFLSSYLIWSLPGKATLYLPLDRRSSPTLFDDPGKLQENQCRLVDGIVQKHHMSICHRLAIGWIICNWSASGSQVHSIFWTNPFVPNGLSTQSNMDIDQILINVLFQPHALLTCQELCTVNVLIDGLPGYRKTNSNMSRSFKQAHHCCCPTVPSSSQTWQGEYLTFNIFYCETTTLYWAIARMDS
jgi:hypothetical protein